MSKHKSEDYKLSAVKYYLENKNTKENTCKIFNFLPNKSKYIIN